MRIRKRACWAPHKTGSARGAAAQQQQAGMQQGGSLMPPQRHPLLPLLRAAPIVMASIWSSSSSTPLQLPVAASYVTSADARPALLWSAPSSSVRDAWEWHGAAGGGGGDTFARASATPRGLLLWLLRCAAPRSCAAAANTAPPNTTPQTPTFLTRPSSAALGPDAASASSCSCTRADARNGLSPAVEEGADWGWVAAVSV